MSSETTDASDSRVVAIAFPWPAGLVFASLWALVLASGLAAFVTLVHEGGWTAFVTLFVGLCAGIACSLLAGLGAPPVAAVVTGVSAWVCGSASALLMLNTIVHVLPSVAPDQRASIIAEGFSEAIASRVLGASLAAGALLGVALSFALRLKRDGVRALAAAGLALAGCALALGSALDGSSLRAGLQAIAQSGPGDHFVILAQIASTHGTVELASWAAAAVGVVIAVAATAVSRAGIAGTVAGALAVSLGVGVDLVVVAAPRAMVAEIDRAPWADLPGFEPIAVDGVPVRSVDAVAAKDGVSVGGKPVVDAATAFSSHGGRLQILVDRRAAAESIALVLDGALAADPPILELVLVGARAQTPSLPPVEPWLAALTVPPASGIVASLGCDKGDVPATIGGDWAVGGSDLVVPSTPRGTPGKPLVLRACLHVGHEPASAVVGAIANLQAAHAEVALAAPDPAPLSTRDADGQRAAIKRVMQQKRRDVRACYERGLDRVPSLQGKVTLEFTIVNGAVTQPRVASTTLNDANVERCIVTASSSWRFPDLGRLPVAVTYPFVFATAD